MIPPCVAKKNGPREKFCCFQFADDNCIELRVGTLDSSLELCFEKKTSSRLKLEGFIKVE